MSESIDTPLLKVPFESLKRRSRERKHVVDGLELLSRTLSQAAESPAAWHNLAQPARLASMVQQVQSMLREVEEIGAEEAQDAQRCRARLQHLAQLGPAPKDGMLDWNRRRLPRVVVDHLLRSGHSRTASVLAQAAKLEDLVDEHIFAAAAPIVEALKRRDCGPALAWAARHRQRLRKGHSKLEFRLRLQEFIELVRAGRHLAAIRHSQQHLAPWAEQHFGELQRAVASLVFGPGTACDSYKPLFAEERWDGLVALFRQELFRLHSMTQQSLLALQLQAGLSALKSPQGAGGHESKEDPLHHPAGLPAAAARPVAQAGFAKRQAIQGMPALAYPWQLPAPAAEAAAAAQGLAALAAGLPFAKHTHSQLVCAITKELMDEHNPPLVLPNGTVYSERAVERGSVDGLFRDPVSGESFQREQMRRAYIS